MAVTFCLGSTEAAYTSQVNSEPPNRKMPTTTPIQSGQSTLPVRGSSLRKRLSESEAFCGWVFIAPALIGFTLFYLLPTIRAFYIGLTNWNLLRAPKFLGFDNYAKLLGDQKFWSSIWVTVLYVIYNIVVESFRFSGMK